VFFVSLSAILVRYALDARAHPLGVAAWRLFLASLILSALVLLLRRQEIVGLKRFQVGIGILAGFFLALHFAFWITSLSFTSIASGTTLSCTTPLWTALTERVIFGERQSRRTWWGIFLALAGTVLLSWGDLQTGSGRYPLLGNLLATVGAIWASFYLIAGKRVRSSISNLSYIWLVYSASAVFLMVTAILTGTLYMGTNLTVYASVLGLAIGPQLLGHSAFNWALVHLSSTIVSLSILTEPLGAAFFAYMLFGETISTSQFLSFTMIFGGVGMATYRR
jgi:drug/metabolite transporter (DMT)-like permease